MQVATIASPLPSSPSKSEPSVPSGFGALLDAAVDDSGAQTTDVVTKQPVSDAKSVKNPPRHGQKTKHLFRLQDAIKEEASPPAQQFPAVQEWIFPSVDGRMLRFAALQADQISTQSAHEVTASEDSASTGSITSSPTTHDDVSELLLRTVAGGRNNETTSFSITARGLPLKPTAPDTVRSTGAIPIPSDKEVEPSNLSQGAGTSGEELARRSLLAETFLVDAQAISAMPPPDGGVIPDSDPTQKISRASLSMLRVAGTTIPKTKPVSLPELTDEVSTQIAGPESNSVELDRAPAQPAPVSTDSQVAVPAFPDAPLQPIPPDVDRNISHASPTFSAHASPISASTEPVTVNAEHSVESARTAGHQQEPAPATEPQIKRVAAEDVALHSNPQGAGPDPTQAPAAISAPDANLTPQPSPKANHTTALPQTHQALDNLPSNSNTVSQARPDFSTAADLQMHLGVRTNAFGMVDIHTTLQQNQVGISIHGEQGLSRWFSAEVPGLESHLNDQRLHLASVEFNGNRSGMETTSSFHHHQPQQQFSSASGPALITPGEVDQPLKPEAVEHSSAADTVITSNHLSIRV
jgi:hypothetical protein